jgi:ribosomal protein S18 acetylase RimI-like enzyme
LTGHKPLQITFRKAAAADLDEIVRLFRAAVRRMDEQGIPQWDEIYPSADVLAEDLTRNELFAGLSEGRIACAFTLSTRCDPEYALACWRRPEPHYFVIHRLCVHPDFQCRRAASQAMAFIEETLRARGVKAVRLDAFSLNPFALRLYERLGYEKTGEVTFRKGLFYLYEKDL